MSQRDRVADTAFGLVLGVGIALLILVWAVPGFRDPAYGNGRQQHTGLTAGQNTQPAASPGFWETYTSPQDTYAQWIAAFSAALGLGVSIAAVVLVWRTLELNRVATDAAIEASKAAVQANKDARDLFAVEQRPWLALKRPEISASLDRGEISLYFSIDAENIGSTPAFAAELKCTMEFSKLVGFSNIVAVREFADSCAVQPAWKNNQKVIFPGKKRNFWEYLREEIPSSAGVLPHNQETAGVMPGGGAFIKVIYCVCYRANGMDNILTTAGEVIFSSGSVESSDDGLLQSVERYSFYGVGYAT
ncbi:hypothetical protein MPL1032_60036 [Mesorhizobium plurifarium]|uniref:Uncharacterized protein n=1 Tax=Mesorhizobium plurifarium TaxID=69974 RepID=A0A0K2W5W2_MESPL|nr:hypothetical protein MPL1032_60036 [Mesorhizobium plurifarium]